MPLIWKSMMVILALCLAASIAIGTYRLSTTPQEVFSPAPESWNSLQWPGDRRPGR